MCIFNLSLAKGILTDDLKSARVTPVFKAGNDNEVRNYRSISILPCFSKILERVMYNLHVQKTIKIIKNLITRLEV